MKPLKRHWAPESLTGAPSGRYIDTPWDNALWWINCLVVVQVQSLVRERVEYAVADEVADEVAEIVLDRSFAESR